MNQRQLYIAGNWKMHKTTGEARSLASDLVTSLEGSRHRILIAPPFTALSAVEEVTKGTNVELGAQNMASAVEGAHTGEVSVRMLDDIGVRTVILGHSERRSIYGESDELINDKIRLAFDSGLEVIFCVGETLDERKDGLAEQVVERQLAKGLEKTDSESFGVLTIAYEPVWAIGTGETATPADAGAMHEFIRSRFEQWYSADIATRLTIQYGGSVKPGNARELLEQEHIDGALVGGASLDAAGFTAIAEAVT